MKILIWPTTFGGDLWSFARYLVSRSHVQVTVVMERPDVYLRQGVAKLFPLNAQIISRQFYHHVLGKALLKPDLTIMDNRVPFVRPSPKGLMLWHGFGWKGPNDEKELKWLHFALGRTWGDARVPNPDFLWQCFGDWDFDHRTRVSGFHPANCRTLGAASHDDLREPIDRSLAQRFYPFDVVRRKTVLFAPTWHYGEVFAHWGGDASLFERLLTRIRSHDANVILRLHDSFRFAPKYRRLLAEFERRFDNVMLKFKDKHPDNYLDLQVSDVLLTNFSSIANMFYATGRPTVHIYPVRHADEEFLWRRYTIAGVISKPIDRAHFIWKLAPEENGGLLAGSFEELLSMTDRALEDPDCCTRRSQDFLDRYMLGADGRSCERIWRTVEELCRGQRAKPVGQESVRETVTK